ncbi:hypothetical protein [Desulfoscipio geothermicus]|uniref:Uncharacterized protein n=1 Tax=Desulfoscipio geothermicus DSM 3669 TaxID=1121426 RepID=A0A1I6CPV0_9FIRM|nr:hypothetical protein [Desulfoscipio geothermicus]SFQ95183.1 hypothetical protein SAMN05660706_101144 [Desulfoscipio geothermicus DSM 3669]
MLIEGVVILTWLGAGASVGSLLTYRLVNGIKDQEMEEKLRANMVENEALSRTNSIYRERIEQLENALFSNEKYLEMAGEIERLSADNFKLRSRMRDLACLVEAEKKKSTWERVERLEKTVHELRNRLEREQQRFDSACVVEMLPPGVEVAAAADRVQDECDGNGNRQKKWATILRARRV